VLKLKKTLYGLKQSPREWYKTISNYLSSLDFNQSAADPCIFVKWENVLTIISVYVDDLIILFDPQEFLPTIKDALKNRFQMSELGELRYRHGLEMRSGKSTAGSGNQVIVLSRWSAAEMIYTEIDPY
jgi:hypothetical protein